MGAPLPQSPPDVFHYRIPARREAPGLWRELERCGYVRPDEKRLSRLDFLFNLDLSPGSTNDEKGAARAGRLAELPESDRRLYALTGAVHQFVQTNYMQEARESWLRGEEHPGHTAFKASLRGQQTPFAQSSLRQIAEGEADAKRYWDRGAVRPYRKVERKMASLKGEADRLLVTLDEVLRSSVLWDALAPSLIDIGPRRNAETLLMPADFVKGLRGQLRELSDSIERHSQRESQAKILTDIRRLHLAHMALLSQNKWELLAAMVVVASEESYAPTADSLRTEYALVSKKIQKQAKELCQNLG